MKKSLKIALAFPMGVNHLERVARGIRQYSREQGGWTFFTSPESHHVEVSDLEGFDGDGIIGFLNTQEDIAMANKLNIPFVNTSGVFESTPHYRVRPDYLEIGRRGAKHALKRGLRNFGFLGVKDVWYSQMIYEGFCEVINKHGSEVSLFEAESSLIYKQNLLPNETCVFYVKRNLKVLLFLNYIEKQEKNLIRTNKYKQITDIPVSFESKRRSLYSDDFETAVKVVYK